MNSGRENPFGVQHVERCQQNAHESGLTGARAHCLHNVIFARVGAGGAQYQDQRDEAKECRNHGEVRSESKFEYAVWVSAANNHRDHDSDD